MTAPSRNAEASPHAETLVVRPHVPFPLPAHHVFGGFWVRFAAYMIDRVVMALPALALFALFVLVLAALDTDSILVGAIVVLALIVTVAWPFAYDILFLGTRSTTPGKMLFGMRVVREDNGGTISWAQAFGRAFAYLLSDIFLIGYVIAGFDAEKRALHDHLAKTRVIRDTRKKTTAGWALFGIIVALCVGTIGALVATAPITMEKEYDDPYGDYSDPAEIVAGADYDEGYRAGYVDGRASTGEFGDRYREPATESRRADYEAGYVEGFLDGCADGNFDCSEIEHAYDVSALKDAADAILQ